ncbi:ATP-binding protein [Candidatus Binatus sp.]|uniref:ATP-binding protein n=1 Tax=Candidatus Binatus sp. TaxID=2811406 RepID=UPI003C71CC8A
MSTAAVRQEHTRDLGLVLRSDVSNDLRQNADQIGNMGKALTELVWNSIQYQPDGQTAIVDVIIKRTPQGSVDEAAVNDNGRGMSSTDLQTFFTMHAENRDRLAGRPGRGRFGTGAKAAAMAVAQEMVVDTIKDGIRTIARLHRDALKSGEYEIPIPSTTSATAQLNGTRVSLKRFRIKRLREDVAKSYLRRALGRALISHRVIWNGEPLEYNAPAYGRQWILHPPAECVAQIGEVELHLFFAESWLPDEERGVTFTSHDVTHECNFLGDHATSPYGNRLFGHVEVPLLEVEDEESRPAYTLDRTMTLNRENLRVRALTSWVSDEIGNVVKALDAEERRQQDRERQERLLQTAKSIEEALNRRLTHAFQNMERKINLKVSAAPSLTGLDVRESDIATATEAQGGTNGDPEYVRDDNGEIRWREPREGEQPDIIVHYEGNGHGEGEGEAVPNGIVDPEGDRGAKRNEAHRNKRRKLEPKGTFRVVPKSMGLDAPRAHYAANHMTIYVNTDHPQIVAAGDEKTPEFKILLAECAASEFVLALTAMRIEHGDPEVDPTQWYTILTAIRREESETGAELAEAIAHYRDRV